MNLNQSVKFNLASLRSLITALIRARATLTALVVLGLFGYTGYQVSRVTNVQPNPAYVSATEAADKIPNLRINKAVLQQLQQLQAPGTTTIQVTTGKQDPFSFN